MTTLAFAVALDSYFLNPTNLPGLVPAASTGPMLWQRFALESQLTMYYLCLAFLVLTIVAAHGRAPVADRAGADRHQGQRAGGGGRRRADHRGEADRLRVLRHHRRHRRRPPRVVLRAVGTGSFQPTCRLEVFSMAVIGGLGSIGGALLGVFTFRLLEQV